MVLRVLEAAVAAKKRFSVYITESQPDLSGQVSFHLVLGPAVILKCKLRIKTCVGSPKTCPRVASYPALPLGVFLPLKEDPCELAVATVQDLGCLLSS